MCHISTSSHRYRGAHTVTWPDFDFTNAVGLDAASPSAGRRLSPPPSDSWRNEDPSRALPHVSLALSASLAERAADRTACGKDNVLGYRGASSAGRSISPAMHETMSPYQPTKTHAACSASPKLPLTHHHLLSLIAQSQGARTRRLPSRTCQERNSLARLGGWAKSAKSGISWVLRRPHPVRLSIPGRADQPFSCNLPATAPRCRHDMQSIIPRGGMACRLFPFVIREARCHPQPVCLLHNGGCLPECGCNLRRATSHAIW
jgi:hypothetical protein